MYVNDLLLVDLWWKYPGDLFVFHGVLFEHISCLRYVVFYK